MDEKTKGFVTAIGVWVSLERLIPQRYDTPADIYVPILLCKIGIIKTLREKDDG